MYGIKPKTMHYWYKEYLSGYRQQVSEGKWGEKKIHVVNEETGEVVNEKAVPIAKEENMGTHMTVDEKQIGKKMYTIMTNLKTGKIAFLAQSQKSEELQEAARNYFPEKLADVSSVSCDMGSSYIKLCRDLFPNARIVIDKFHVVMHLMEALQQVRRQIKTLCINHPDIQVNLVSLEDPEEQKQWTDIELLERCRYVICRKEGEWDEEEREMMNYLFRHYPLLEKAYGLTQKLREWYDKKYIGADIDLRERDLYDWCDDALQSKIPAFKAVRKMVEKHHDNIINYFNEGQTNAKAENMNGKIQRFLANNFGIRDRDFFLFRLAGYFS
jgi:transposase